MGAGQKLLIYDIFSREGSLKIQYEEGGGEVSKKTKEIRRPLWTGPGPNFNYVCIFDVKWRLFELWPLLLRCVYF